MVSKNLHFILLNIGFATHNGDWNYTNVISPFARLYLVTGGKAMVTINEKQHILKPDHIYLIPPYTVHTDSCAGNFNLYYLHIYDESLDTISLYDQFEFPFEVKASELDQMLFKRIYEINPNRMLRKYDPKEYDTPSFLDENLTTSRKRPLYVSIESKAIIQQLISRFIVGAQQQATTSDQRIINALKYINTHINTNIRIKDIADICFVSTDHFIRLFKKEMKTTPTNYINRKRIEKAQLLLSLNSEPIKQIAYSLSFDNISYFNRLFKHFTGITPAEYRKRLGGTFNIAT
ncbi:helix-turn-helix transcriptional regulator [Plebeiibacterium marinum]|uniref:AraC family transcriptional regulator n=1 Tax=Plebeiibacterium marinum TaxID=2992111 RepID=A0AAE3SJV9_9BACT|nr:AraC family transcriptional regulator [Plebeiobacterium marinum]MCW3805853.1 AraC family transcriptional regulator [Plebeiobacterium marinum]